MLYLSVGYLQSQYQYSQELFLITPKITFMKLLKPQVQLVRKTHIDQEDEFSLHAITYLPKTNYKADGYEIASQLDSDGVLPIALYISKDESIPELHYLTPIVHTLNMGVLPFSDGEGMIKVNLVVNGIRSGEGAGTTHTTTADSDEEEKPTLPADF